MFFSKKGAGLAGKVAEVLAAYFSLTAKDTLGVAKKKTIRVYK